MKRLGIFLGFTPKHLVPHEGIARLIGFIVKGASSSGEISVTIGAPAWLKADIVALLDDADVPDGFVDIVTTSGEPFLFRFWRVSEYFRRGKKKPQKRKYRLKRAAKYVASLLVSLLTTTSIPVFLVGAIVAAAVAVVLAIPVVLVIVLLVGIYLLKRIWPRLLRHRVARPIVDQYYGMKNSLRSLRPEERAQERELVRLVKKLNKRTDIDVWYIPSMYWPQVAGLKGKVVMAAPDIVFYEHPSQYTSADLKAGLQRITASIAAADHLICYSDHVKQHHLVERQDVPANRVSVIRHGAVDMHQIERGDGTREAALDVLHDYIADNSHLLPSYLQGFRFDDVDFLFYSSQARPHKNIEGLVKVYEKILREHYRPVKLVLTAQFASNPRIKDLIAERKLGRDVISLSSVPNHVLAALYRLAALSVTPTFFEGGFPFTFSEAFSVGTPSVMSRIPVVKEIIQDEALLEMMTFNPADRAAMLEKILWGLDNRDALVAAQQPLFESLATRTWSIAAGDYLDVMRSVVPAVRGR